jgi:hypothetical protein
VTLTVNYTDEEGTPREFSKVKYLHQDSER